LKETKHFAARQHFTYYATNFAQTQPAFRHRFAYYGTRSEQTAPHAMC